MSKSSFRFALAAAALFLGSTFAYISTPSAASSGRECDSFRTNCRRSLAKWQARMDYAWNSGFYASYFHALLKYNQRKNWCDARLAAHCPSH